MIPARTTALAVSVFGRPPPCIARSLINLIVVYPAWIGTLGLSSSSGHRILISGLTTMSRLSRDCYNFILLFAEDSMGKDTTPATGFFAWIEAPRPRDIGSAQDLVLHCSWGGCERPENQTLEPRFPVSVELLVTSTPDLLFKSKHWCKRRDAMLGHAMGSPKSSAGSTGSGHDRRRSRMSIESKDQRQPQRARCVHDRPRTARSDPNSAYEAGNRFCRRCTPFRCQLWMPRALLSRSERPRFGLQQPGICGMSVKRCCQKLT